MTEGLYHYTLCGLDNIYLSGGFTLEDTDYGPAVSIEDIDGLHRAIAMDIVLGASRIVPKELRFLRKQLGLSQANFAVLVGVDAQTVARWEKGENTIPVPADRLVRFIYLGETNGDVQVRKILNTLKEMDEIEHGRRVFKETRTGWKAAA